MRPKMRNFLKNAIVMAAAALFIRTVSVSFNAYLSDSIGGEGMGLFSLVSSIYSFAVTFAVSGVSLAVTRLVSEHLGRGEAAAARAALRRATVYALSFSCVASAVLLFGADHLGGVVLGDVRTVLSIRILAASLVPLALSSVMGGYFTAVGRVVGNSATQVAEQGIRILFTVLLILRLAPKGMTYACAAVVAGNVIAQIVGCLILAVQFLRDKRRHLGGEGGDARGITGRLLHIALPVALSTYIRSGLLTLEHILIPRALTRGGNSHTQALSSYGILEGMALPVVLYPMAILSSFSGLLIPHYAEHRVRGQHGAVRYIASRSLHLTTVFAMGCTALLFVFSRDLGRVIYGSDEAGEFIRVLSLVVPVMFLDHVTDCALKGLGEQVYSMWVNIADSVISIGLVWLILPHFGAMGYVYVIILAELFNYGLSAWRLRRVCGVRYRFLRSFCMPLCAALLCALAVEVLMPIDHYTVTLPWLILKMLFAFSVYVGLLATASAVAHLRGKQQGVLDVL